MTTEGPRTGSVDPGVGIARPEAGGPDSSGTHRRAPASVTRLIVFAPQFTVVPAFWALKTFIGVAEKSSTTVRPARGALFTSLTTTSKPAGAAPIAFPDAFPTTTRSVVEKRGSGTPAEATEATTASPAAMVRAFRTIPVISCTSSKKTPVTVTQACAGCRLWSMVAGSDTPFQATVAFNSAKSVELAKRR